MRALIATLALVLSLGCATSLGPEQIAAETDVAVRVAARIVELIADPTATADTCTADTALLADLAEVIADRIDGGDASGSHLWALFDHLVALLSSAGCQFVPELESSGG